MSVAGSTVEALGPKSAAASSRGASAIAIAFLVGVPLVLFGGALLAGGHLLLSGDNLIQNYPLRVLVGTELRGGAVPAWDPYAFSGTPLMSGLNAGAWFPTTLLFAVVPAHLAWVIGEIAAVSSIGVGTFWLFRAGGAGVPACLLGAATFTFAGAVATQAAVHVDMGDGVACLPWALLAIRRIVDDGRWRWAALLGAALALPVLAGSPEALLGLLGACIAFALLRWSLTPGSGRRLFVSTAGAAAFAIGATAFVWIPALRFISISQRASVSEAAASGYAFSPRAALLALVPYLEGGGRLFSEGRYFGPSNLAEVTLYIGILPVVAAVALAGRRWATWLPRGERRCWYGVLAVALVLAIGAGTPLEHLLYHLPLYGRQRDSGRSIVEVDLAASALLTWWIDGGSRPAGAHSRGERLAAAVPLGLVVATALWWATSPSGLWHFLGASPLAPRPQGTLAELALQGALCAVAGILVVSRARLSTMRWRRLVAGFVLVDLVCFSTGSALLSTGDPPSPARPGPLAALIKESLASGGRYVVFDPGQFDQPDLPDAVEPDLGILDKFPAASGYGSLENGIYGAETVTTGRDYIAPEWISPGASGTLGLEDVVTVPESFLSAITTLPTTGRATTRPVPAGTDPALPGGNLRLPLLPPVPETSPPRAAVHADAVASWWFGTSMALTGVLVRFDPLASPTMLRSGLISSSGATRWSRPVVLTPGTSSAAFRFTGPPADGLELQVNGHGTVDEPQVFLAAGARAYALDGALANTVEPSSWSEVGSADDFSVFRSDATVRQAWLEGGAVGSATVTASSFDSMTLRVTASRPGALALSLAYDPGWSARMVGASGATSEPGTRDGLVESFAVPVGTSTLSLSYETPGFGLGALVAAATCAGALAGLIAAAALGSRRRGAAGTGAQDQEVRR